MRIKQALRYHLEYMLVASPTVLGVVLAFTGGIMLIGAIFSADPSDTWISAIASEIQNGSLNINVNVASLAIVSLFIVGIAGIREDIKMLIQHGMGRRTTFFSTLLCSAIIGIVFGLTCELFNLAAARWYAFPLIGFTPHPGQSFLLGWVLHASLFIASWQLGVLISLIYYRLNGFQQIIFSVLGVMALILLFRSSVNTLFNSITNEAVAVALSLGDPLILTAFSMLGAALASVLSYLLIRSAQVAE